MRFCIVAIVFAILGGTIAIAQQPQAVPATQPPSASQPAEARAPKLPRDQPLPTAAGKMLTFEVLIAELDEPVESPTATTILELAKTGRLRSVSRLQVSSLEGQPASVQFGQLQSRVGGTIQMRGAPAPRGRGGPVQPGRGFGPGGPAVQQPLQRYRDVNVGTLAQMTARVEDDGSIATQFFIERTGLAPDAAPPDPGANAAPNSVDRLSTSTTVRLKPGEPQIIGGRQGTAGTEHDKTWIVLSVQVDTIPPKPATEAK